MISNSGLIDGGASSLIHNVGGFLVQVKLTFNTDFPTTAPTPSPTLPSPAAGTLVYQCTTEEGNNVVLKGNPISCGIQLSGNLETDGMNMTHVAWSLIGTGIDSDGDNINGCNAGGGPAWAYPGFVLFL